MIRITALLASLFVIGTAQAKERFITLSSGTSTEDSSDLQAASTFTLSRSARATRLRLENVATPTRYSYMIGRARKDLLPTALVLIGVS